MAIFKVGDRVRRIKHSGKITNCPVGFETIVEDFLGYGNGFWYRGADGSRQNSTTPTDWELVETGPVRTVTRKEIVPGVYGVVRVYGTGSRGVNVDITGNYSHKSSDELRAAASVFNELADALDVAQ